MSRNNSSPREKPKWIGFYNWRISDSEKKAIKANLLKETQVTGFLCDCADNGYKVSVSFDTWGNCYMVSVTGSGAECKNAGWTLTCRHADVLVALSSARFFLAEKHEWGQWPEHERPLFESDW